MGKTYNLDNLDFNPNGNLKHGRLINPSFCPVNGKDILTDSGTFSYNYDKKLRRFFRSTQAHNTIYTGKDQSFQVGSFRWVEQPKTSLKKLVKRDYIGFEGRVKTKDRRYHERKVILKR